MIIKLGRISGETRNNFVSGQTPDPARGVNAACYLFTDELGVHCKQTGLGTVSPSQCDVVETLGTCQ